MKVLSIEEAEDVQGAVAPVVIAAAIGAGTALAGMGSVLYGASQGWSCSFSFGSGFSFSCNT